MPIYDFHCESCGPFVAMRSIAERDRAAPCPVCGTIAARLVTAPSLALMSSERRIARAANERAAHAPQLSGEVAAARHRPGCSCCSSGRATLAGASGGTAIGTASGSPASAVAGAPALKRPAGRPWMISH
ncbi:FmdB family zinc ribbon protein [Burkholderia catarinensis]|uniref:FmdB family zinc ribbon protein n=1 Tax=Burkholderia catarinensis TaxID=1108140 RepID=UPI001C579025|nr:zinc ribbon domain-containing protein [Burkholderia catarinensis]KAG8152479.1 FmdB family transcriptional regulator [Burkholderia catarinensis]